MAIVPKIIQYFNANYGYIIFIILGILSIPFSLYIFNANEFGYDLILILLPMTIAISILLIGLLMSWLGRLFLKKFNAVNYHLQNILSVLGLIIFINDFFIPTKAGALKGIEEVIAEPIMLTVLELLVSLVFITMLIMGVKNKKISKFFITCSHYAIAIFVVFLATISYMNIFNKKESNPKETNPEKIVNRYKSIKKAPNIYFIWLDGMQSDFFIKGINEYNLANKFSDFTLFKNNTSNYLYSLQSYQSFMTGTLFKGGDYKSWGEKETFRKLLKENDYNLTSYTMANFVSPLDDISYTTENIFKQSMQINHPFVSDFIQSWLIRMAPNVLANETYEFGKVLGEKVSNSINSNKIKISTVIDGIFPFTAPIVINKAINEEESRGSHNEFVMVHTILPHTPYVLDEQCNYIGKIDKKKLKLYKRYYKQVSCASLLTIKFLNNLKRLKHYNDSIIVIFGDHGSGWTYLFNKDKHKSQKALNPEYSRWKEEHVLMRSSAMLMVKPVSNNSNSLVISNKETQHIDIIPTLVSLLGMDKNAKLKFDGRNLFNPYANKRDKIISYYKPTSIPDFNDAEIYNIITNENNEIIDLEYADKFHSYYSDKQTQTK